MCYSFRTSLISFTFGILSAMFALYTRQTALGILILAYSQMQLSEAMIWYGIDNNNMILNKIGTSYGKYTLPTHIFAIGTGILLAVMYNQKRPVTLKDYIPMIIGACFFLFVVFYYYIPTKSPDVTYPYKACKDKSCQNMNNRLRWAYPTTWYPIGFLISLIICIIYIKPLKSGIFLSSSFTILFFASLYIFKIVMPSMWCFSTAILAPLLVTINYFLTR